MTTPVVPRLSWPLVLDGSTLAVVEQDSLDEVAQCVALVVSTQVGSRAELPGYGIEDPTGQRNPTSADVLAAITEWEPRAVTDDGGSELVDGLATIIVDITQ